MLKKYKWPIIILLSFLFIFFYTLFFVPVNIDEIWEFGFGYNIATGLIPYRDFNMLATPLYAFIISIFIKFIGPYLLSVNIFNSIVLIGMFCLIYKMIKHKLFILIPFIMMFSYPTYNNLLMFFFFLLIYVKRSEITDEKKLIYSSLIISLMFLTKQSVGAVFFVLEFFLTKDKKKYILFFSIPIVILIIYLLFNHALYNFIDYCFLGLLDFGTRNGNVNYLLFLWINILIVSIILYIKDRKVDILYVMAYQTISFPIFDLFHINMSIIVLLFIILDIYFKKFKKAYVLIITILILIAPTIKNYNSYINNKIFKEDNYLFARKYDQNIMIFIEETSKIIDKYNDKYDKIYNLTRHSYMVKLYRKDIIEKFDMTLNGNMGYQGYKKYIKDIDEYCQNNKCLLIIETGKTNNYMQRNYEIIDYVTSNYNFVEYNHVLNYSVYSN